MGLTAFNSVITAMWLLPDTKAWIEYLLGGKHSRRARYKGVFDVWFLDISTLEGVLWLGILSLVPTLLLDALFGHQGLKRKYADESS